MGAGLLGFMAGASGQALDAMKSRQDDERETRKAKMLEELRRDTAVFLADYQEKLSANKVDDKLSSYAPETGEFVMRNGKGEEIGRRKDVGMAEEYDFNRKKDKLSLEAASAQIEQARAGAEENRAQAARARQGAALDKITADSLVNPPKPTDGEVAAQLLEDAKDATAQARQKGVTQAEIERLALRAVQNARSPDHARSNLVNALAVYLTPDNQAAQKKRQQVSLDKFEVATGQSGSR